MLPRLGSNSLKFNSFSFAIFNFASSTTSLGKNAKKSSRSLRTDLRPLLTMASFPASESTYGRTSILRDGARMRRYSIARVQRLVSSQFHVPRTLIFSTSELSKYSTIVYKFCTALRPIALACTREFPVKYELAAITLSDNLKLLIMNFTASLTFAR